MIRPLDLESERNHIRPTASSGGFFSGLLDMFAGSSRKDLGIVAAVTSVFGALFLMLWYGAPLPCGSDAVVGEMREGLTERYKSSSEVVFLGFKPDAEADVVLRGTEAILESHTSKKIQETFRGLAYFVPVSPAFTLTGHVTVGGSRLRQECVCQLRSQYDAQDGFDLPERVQIMVQGPQIAVVSGLDQLNHLSETFLPQGELHYSVLWSLGGPHRTANWRFEPKRP